LSKCPYFAQGFNLETDISRRTILRYVTTRHLWFPVAKYKYIGRESHPVTVREVCIHHCCTRKKLHILKQEIPKRREKYFQKQRKLHENYNSIILEPQGAEHGKNAVKPFKTDIYLKVRAKVKPKEKYW